MGVSPDTLSKTTSRRGSLSPDTRDATTVAIWRAPRQGKGEGDTCSQAGGGRAGDDRWRLGLAGV